MRVRRRRSRRLPFWLWLVLVILVVCVCGALLIPAIPGLVLRLAGFAPQGSVDSFWAQHEQAENASSPGLAVANPALPPADWFQQASAPDAVYLDAGSAGSVTLGSDETFAEAILVGEANDGQPLGVAQYDEATLRALCDYWLNGCATEQFRGSHIDLRPGGAVIYGSANVGGLWQEAGVVLTLSPSRTGLEAAGVVLNGTLYAIPPEGEVADLVQRLVRELNAALHELSVRAGGYTLNLAAIRITDDLLTLILR